MTSAVNIMLLTKNASLYSSQVCNHYSLCKHSIEMFYLSTRKQITSVLTGVSEVDGTMVVSVEDGRVCTYDLTKSSLTPSPLLINGGVTISLAISVQNNSFLFVATTANRVEKVS